MAKIRQVTLRDPTMSSQEVVDELKTARWGNAPIILTWGYVDKLRKKIIRQRMHNVNSSVLARINEIKERSIEVQKRLWIEALGASKAGDRILALKEITRIDNQILQAEMDAGIYERNIGTLKAVADRHIQMADVIKNTDETTRNQLIKALKVEIIGEGGEGYRLPSRLAVPDRARDLSAPTEGDREKVETGEVA